MGLTISIVTLNLFYLYIIHMLKQSKQCKRRNMKNIFKGLLLLTWVIVISTAINYRRNHVR